MSVTKRVSINEYNEPTVTITINGWDDAFRFAWAMGHLQCEFADVARRIGGSLKRHLGAKQFGELNRRYTGQITHHWVREDDAYADERV